MEKKFYNRYKDRKFIYDKIQFSDDKDENIIIFLSGNNGIGKSALIENISKQKLLNREFIHINNNTDCTLNVSDGYFLRRIYEVLDNYCNQHLERAYNGNKYQMLTFDFWKDRMCQFFKNITSLPDLFNDNLLENKSLNMLKQYIIYVLKEEKLIINIENIQQIDIASLDYLKEIIKSVHSTIFIFQYTFSDEDHHKFHKFYDNFSFENNTIINYELDELDFSEARNLLPSREYTNGELCDIKHSYMKAKGNLYNIKHYRVGNNNIPVIRYDNKEECAILFFIHLNGNSAKKEFIYSLLTNVSMDYICLSKQQFRVAIDSLIDNNTIETNNDMYFLPEIIVKELDNRKIDAIKNLVYSTLNSFYEQRIIENNNDSDALFHIFLLSLNFLEKNIIKYLHLLKEQAFKEKYPFAIIENLKRYIQALKDNGQLTGYIRNAIYKAIVEIMIESSDVINAEYFLNQIMDSSDPNHLIMKSKILLLKDSNHSLKELEELFQSFETENNIKLIIGLSLLQLKLKRCAQKVSMDFAKELYENETFKNFPEYAFVLTNYAELLSNPNVAIEKCIDAIEILEKEERLKKYVSFVYANMAMHYGYLGKVEKATNCMGKMNYPHRDIEMYFYNNVAVLDIINCNVKLETIGNFNEALSITIYDYERIIIHNNLLISYILLENFDAARIEYKYLKTCEFEKYKNNEFLLMNYRNIVYYLNSTKANNGEIDKYKQKISVLSHSNSTIKSAQIIAQCILSDTVSKKYYYTQLKYYPEFLCYWGVPLLLIDK